MGFFWQLLAPFNKRHKRALKQLEQAFPDMPAPERERIARAMWRNLGRVAAETFHIDRLLKQNHRFEAVPDETTRGVLEGEKPCLFVSMHSGNWELCVQPAVRCGLKITGVYQALRNPEADKAIRSLRADLYTGGLLSKSHQTARKILATLKAGGVVAMMGDLRESRGVEITFFGQNAFANSVPASLARACNVPIILGRVVRKKGVHFRIETRTLTVTATDNRQEDVRSATQEIHDIFEEWIRDCPEQWMWIHRKWALPGENAAMKRARRAAAAKSIAG